MDIVETAGNCGYSCRFSPFHSGVFACVGGTNFGLQGTGGLFVHDINGKTGVVQQRSGPVLPPLAKTKDALFDLCWSESMDDHLITAGGDGVLTMWQVANKSLPAIARSKWQAHQREIFSVDWNTVDKRWLLSGSWDLSIRLWEPHRGPEPLSVWPDAHTDCVYSCAWSPHDARLFASGGGDCLCKLWSIDQQSGAGRRPLITLPAHSAPVLSVDFCKYPTEEWGTDLVLATAAVDGSIKVWDLRQPMYPLQQLNGHRMGVRRLRWSPFQGRLLASCGYDMTVRLWDARDGRCLRVIDDHGEFVCGLDWDLFDTGGLLASCSWDRTVRLTRVGSGRLRC